VCYGCIRGMSGVFREVSGVTPGALRWCGVDQACVRGVSGVHLPAAGAGARAPSAVTVAPPVVPPVVAPLSLSVGALSVVSVSVAIRVAGPTTWLRASAALRLGPALTAPGGSQFKARVRSSCSRRSPSDSDSHSHKQPCHCAAMDCERDVVGLHQECVVPGDLVRASAPSQV